MLTPDQAFDRTRARFGGATAAEIREAVRRYNAGDLTEAAAQARIDEAIASTSLPTRTPPEWHLRLPTRSPVYAPSLADVDLDAPQ